MKKRLLIILLPLLLVGCNKGTTNTDLNLDSINNNLKGTDLFTETESVDITYLEKKYGLSTEGISDYSVYMASKTMSASMYAIFKVDNDTAKENIENDFIDKYIDSWTVNVYDAHEADLVNNMYTEEYGNYLIYIVSEDNNKALEIIKG